MPTPKGEPEGLFSRMARFVRAPAGGREDSQAGATAETGAAGRLPSLGSPPPGWSDPQDSGALADFASSQQTGLEVAELAYDPDLEDAAIRFASGDDAGALAALLALLAPGSARADHEETWLALFDLLRATGQQAAYDDHALTFADRFGRSAPQWQTLVSPGAGETGAASAPPRHDGAGPRADWTCPGVLDGAGVAGLRAALSRTAPPWCLSWTALVRLERDGVDALCELLGQWAAQPVQLHFLGADRLDQVLAAVTVTGERGNDPAWWTLRMQALRVMLRADEFDQVALDYCVTYEVSPPSWDRPRCQFSAVSELAAGADPVPSRALLSASPAPLKQAPAELVGAVQGDATELLRRVEALQPQGSPLVISCAQLARIDFTAAGTLLNWATARQAEGREVHLTHVHRLVASFLDVIGVSAQARVSVRRD